MYAKLLIKGKVAIFMVIERYLRFLNRAILVVTHDLRFFT